MQSRRFISCGAAVLRAFVKNQRGSIAVMSAFLLPIMIGIVALVYEFGNGVLTRAQYQRIADAASYAGALAYNATSSTTSMTDAAKRVATINGLAPGDLTVSLASSPSGDGNESVQVTMAATNVLLLAPVLQAATHVAVSNQLAVSSVAYAEMNPQTSGCVMALKSSGTGVTLSGGTSVTADSCVVASNSSVSVPCGTTITTQKVSYDSSSAPSEPCSGIVAPSGDSLQITKASVTDPLAANTEVTGGTSRLTNVEGMSDPSGSSGSAVTFNYYGTISGLPTGCSLSPATTISPPYTVVCSGTGPFNFAGLTVNSTATIENTSSSVATYVIGAGASCSGNYSICVGGGGSLTFLGPSSFVLPGGISVSGGASATLAAETVSGSTVTNDSYQIGYNSGTSGDYAINVGGGGDLVLGDAVGSSDLFTVNGNITTAGGSCLWLPAAAEHDVNGYISTSGGISLADNSLENNIYTVSDYVWFGANGGGNVTCNGQDFGVQAVNTTMYIAGLSVPSSGTCGNQAFCVAAGYSDVDWTAPSTGSTENLAVVGPTSSSITSGALFTEGSSGSSISGAFYFPYGAITLDGAGSVSGSGCLEIIGSQVTLSGGSSAASSCTNLTSSSGSAISLVQ